MYSGAENRARSVKLSVALGRRARKPSAPWALNVSIAAVLSIQPSGARFRSDSGLREVRFGSTRPSMTCSS